MTVVSFMSGLHYILNLFLFVGSKVTWKANVLILASISFACFNHLTRKQLILKLQTEDLDAWPFARVERTVDMINVAAIDGNVNFLLQLTNSDLWEHISILIGRALLKRKSVLSVIHVV